MKLVEKSWLWKLTGPFASNNYTTIGSTLYYPKGKKPSSTVIAHEEVHEAQYKEFGVFFFMFLYLFSFPILWNDFRWAVEYEAYKKGNKFSDEQIRKLLRSYRYGWLRNG